VVYAPADVEIQSAVDQEQEYERELVNGPQGDGPGMPGTLSGPGVC
jgi:hypothetical protein